MILTHSNRCSYLFLFADITDSNQVKVLENCFHRWTHFFLVDTYLNSQWCLLNRKTKTFQEYFWMA